MSDNPALKVYSQPRISLKIWICTVCGYHQEGEEPPEICPDCGAPRDKFIEL
jgi:rubrerythrin